jgi:hypothetical protein
VLFVPAGTPLELHSAPDAQGACRMLAYAATANDCMFVSAEEATRNMFRSVSDLSLLRHTHVPVLAEAQLHEESATVVGAFAPRATS